MKSVSQDEAQVKAPPQGFISRCAVEKAFNFSKTDFDLEEMKKSALVCKAKGQIGLFFPLDTVREIDSWKLGKIPETWVPEQTVLRSFRKSELPDGFPKEYRQLGRYGKQAGRSGPATYFYSKDCLLNEFNLKVLNEDETYIWAKDVPFPVKSPPLLLLRLTKPFTLIAPGFCGTMAQRIVAARASQTPSVPSSPEHQSASTTPDKSSTASDLFTRRSPSINLTPFNSPGSFSLSPTTAALNPSPIGPQDMTMSSMLEAVPVDRNYDAETPPKPDPPAPLQFLSVNHSKKYVYIPPYNQ